MAYVYEILIFIVETSSWAHFKDNFTLNQKLEIYNTLKWVLTKIFICLILIPIFVCSTAYSKISLKNLNARIVNDTVFILFLESQNPLKSLFQ